MFFFFGIGVMSSRCGMTRIFGYATAYRDVGNQAANGPPRCVTAFG